MIGKYFLLFVIYFALGLSKSYAGWYECYNYEGTIGKYPITLSIQIRDGYFGAEDKKDFNVIGVYKYDKYNNPIKLEGKLKNNQIRLYEYDKGKESAVLDFEFSENISLGIWTNTKSTKTLPINLKYISKLVDTSEFDTYENVEILQLNSLKNFYFIGVYSKKQDEMSAYMDKIKIVSKQDNTLFQEIDFKDLDFKVGNAITIIYQNTEISDLINNHLIVWCDVGRIGGFFTLRLNKQRNKFVTNYELNIDG